MSNSKIYLGLDLLDFTGEINVKRQVNDYRDPNIGSSNKSYTLDIPLTPSNQTLLKFVNDLRSRQLVTDTARILVDGIEVIRGTLRILSFNSMYVKAIVEADDWVDEISATKIDALSWVSGDEHSFTSANIVASWSAAAGNLYRYPLINFAELISGEYGSSGSAIYSYEFYPMWNIEDIVTKVFLDAGYTLAGSGFFASTFGRSLYLLSRPRPAEEDFISGKEMKVYVNDNTDNYDTVNVASGGTDGLTVAQTLDLDQEEIDEGSDFSTSTNRYTAPVAGTYRFQSQVTIYCSFNRDIGRWTVTNESLTYTIRKNGSTTLEQVFTNSLTAFTLGNHVYTLDTGYVHLEAGDYIDVYVQALAVAQNIFINPLDAYLYVQSGITTSFFHNSWDAQNLWPGIGKTMSPSDYLPEISGIDFMKGMKEAFNLRFWMDRNNKTIYIETSDDFYGDTVLDLGDRIDYSEDVEMEVIASNYRRTQVLKWKPDTSDKAYTNEVAANGIPLTKELVLESEYARVGTTENQNKTFSPTPLGDMPQIGHWGQQKIPRIFGSADFVSASRPYPATRPKAWASRILAWKGMVALTTGNFDYYEDIQDATATNYTTFPSAECPDMSDMYDDYLLKDWSRIDNNKIVTCVLKMTPAELIPFSTVVGVAAEEGFRATYQLNIDGVDMYFLLNKVTTDGDRVKCEFVQKL